MIDNYKELNEIVSKMRKINDVIEHCGYIGTSGSYHGREVVSFNNVGGKSNFNDVGQIIGWEKLASIVAQFKDLLCAELYKYKIETEHKMVKYKILKED